MCARMAALDAQMMGAALQQLEAPTQDGANIAADAPAAYSTGRAKKTKKSRTTPPPPKRPELNQHRNKETSR